jgi:PhnB protein
LACIDRRVELSEREADGARFQGGTKVAAGQDEVRPIPEGYGAVTPWVISRDTGRLIDFMTAAFDAVETARVLHDDGTIGHAEVRIGDSVVMAFDARPEWPDTPAFLRLYVADSDAVYRRAIGAGASSVTEVTELFFGDRVGRVRDPLGNVWWIQTHVVDLEPEEMWRRAAQPDFVESMRYVENAEIVQKTR